MSRKLPSSSPGTGLFFILLAGLLYAINTGQFRGEIGNLFLVFLSILFFSLFFFAKLSWAVLPAAFFLTSGLAIYFSSLSLNMQLLWPLYIFLPGASFIIIYLLSPVNRWALLPGLAIIATSIFYFIINIGFLPEKYYVYYNYLPPFLAAVIGLKIILFPAGKKKTKH